MTRSLDSIHAQFKVVKAPVKLVVLLRVTGDKARPHSLQRLENHRQSSGHRHASQYLDFCFRRGFLHDSNLVAGRGDAGVYKLIRSLALFRLVKIEIFWSNHERAKKKAAQAESSRAVSELDQGRAASEQGKRPAGALSSRRRSRGNLDLQ